MSGALQDAIVRVGLGARAYDVVIGVGAIDRAGALMAPLLKRPRVVIVTDENVATMVAPRFEAALAAGGIAHQRVTLPPGEATKSFAMLERLSRELLVRGVERSDLVVALGGGVIGDLVGFAASILRRGIGFVQVPTSLLAQVDSSVGGKTAINTPEGKNLVGAFHQPRLVIADIAALDSLPRREALAGYAEIAKYGLLGDAAFFSWLEENGARVAAGDHAARLHAVVESVRAKAEIVAEDEREEGRRALLNLGHTFGHALEGATGFSDRLLHGEGVAVGMALAFHLSERLGHCAVGTADRVEAHLKGVGLRTRVADIANEPLDPDHLVTLMGQDKKVAQGRLTFILARAIGDAFITQDVPADAVRTLMADACAGRV